MRLIAVTLSAPDDWRDHKELLDFGFERYVRWTFAKKGEFTTTLEVMGGEISEAVVANAAELSALLRKDHEEIEFIIEANRPIFAPITRGEELGRIICFEDGKEIANSPLVAVTKVEMTQKKRGPLAWLTKLFTG